MKKLDLYSEPELLKAIREGESMAFNHVHRKYHRLLIGFSFNIVASEVNAEDIVAEAFARLYLSRKNMKSMGHVRRFLYMITRNRSVDWIRSRRARLRFVASDLVDLSGEAVEPVDEFIESMPEMLRVIRLEVENLPLKCREVFKLFFYEEKTTSEISELLNIHPQTVLNHKSIAVKTLRSKILLHGFSWS